MITVGAPYLAEDDGCPVVCASVDIEGSSYELRFRVSEGPIAVDANAFLAASLLPAMKVGGRLRIDGNVSPRVLASTAKIQEIFHAWFPTELQAVSVEAKAEETAMSVVGRGVGCFFSGGADSFYSVLKHRDEITKLIFVHGLDVRLDDHALRDKVIRGVREAAAELGKPLIEVETNSRGLSDPRVDWLYVQHGAALTSIALLLAPQFRKVYIASYLSYAHLRPVGCHPLVDPLWSSEATEVVHDGCEATKFEKIAKIVESDAALRHLRVCWDNRDGAYNCCRCQKCLQTMVSLRAVGALHRCTSFGPLDLAAVSSMPLTGFNSPLILAQSLATVERSGNDPELAEVIRGRLKQTMPPSREELTILSRRLAEREVDVAALKELVAGYERGRAMRLLNTIGGLRQRLLG